MNRYIPQFLFVVTCIFLSGCTDTKKESYTIPSEFEEQEYIWLTWVESGFLGGEPFKVTAMSAMKEITPYVKVRLFYGPQMGYDSAQLKSRIYESLIANNIDTSRITLFYNEVYCGAIQDSGPVFLRNTEGRFAIADFNFLHPDNRTASIDKNVAAHFNLPVISSTMISEGGAWQTNGRGTMLLVESVELDRNKSMTKKQIEEEYKRVLGVTKFIWLKKGAKEEEWGKLENGKYGIGTSGHVDEFCRFVNDSTVLLAAVAPADTIGNEISKETYRRMEENYKILLQSTDQDGKPLDIIRLPAGPLMSKNVAYKNLSKDEQSWFDQVTTDSVEFYLATGYMNFIIANQVVVAGKCWKEGLPFEFQERDKLAKSILEKAFPGRKIVQIDCMPLHHDGGGLHCHSRNQPKGKL
ncbi:MAG TPA: agmatine deiminase family protein [Chitinophagaceae bacterium]|nr:agmatine deiminase family protein [Chitinophagaceae bacterium]HPH30467.1 agmatine deiminase family protein [Chitinophagaceae bacterium]HPN57650.1 agmatine deiminase family protein [Chitinophagaceae bacterium]HRG24243.1 agmatine deiminase family protein [Chitinophagaceae bacterium]